MKCICCTAESDGLREAFGLPVLPTCYYDLETISGGGIRVLQAYLTLRKDVIETNAVNATMIAVERNNRKSPLEQLKDKIEVKKFTIFIN